MERMQVGWVPALGQVQTLRSPFERDEGSLVRAAEDFTVRLTHISKSLFHNYKEQMQADGRHHNDDFIVMTEFGIGSHGGGKPSKSINLVESIDAITSDIMSFWGENIRWVEDYQDQGSGENTGRIYLSCSACCQNINGTRTSLGDAASQVVGVVGRFVPALSPVAAAVQGIKAIAEKFTHSRFQGEVKRSTITLYPGTTGINPHGDAYLHYGSYVLFFEDVDISQYQILPSGKVEAIAGSSAVPQLREAAYVVINIVPGLFDAPSQETLNNAVALDILEEFDDRYGLQSLSEAGKAQNPSVVNGLSRLGEAYRFKSKLTRYRELSQKPAELLSAPEQERLQSLQLLVSDLFG